MVRKKTLVKLMLFSFIVPFFLYSCSSAQVTDNYVSQDVVPKFVPVKDDELAKRYAPLLESGSQYGDPYGLYYRASRDETGNTHITYHYIWEKEENTGPGTGACLSRNLYTGGLKMQKSMFGKGDVELLSFVIDPAGNIQFVEFETAENYDAKNFSVIHQHAERKGLHKLPLLFKVISWNHLFDYVKDNADASTGVTRLTPLYFNEKLWREYGMIKESESYFRRNRAHKNYEKEFVE